MRGSDVTTLSRAPRSALRAGAANSRWRWIPEPAVGVLLLILLLAAAGGAATLVTMRTTLNQAVEKGRLAQQYDQVHAELTQVELLRHEVLTGEAAAFGELTLARAGLDRQAAALVAHNARGLKGEDPAGDDGVFAARVIDYQKADDAWNASGRNAGVDEGRVHLAAAALTISVQTEIAEHQRDANAAEGHRGELLTALEWVAVPVFLLFFVAAAAAARKAGRARLELLSAKSLAEWNSLHDPLTGLPNRTALSIEMKAQGPEVPVALFWLDLDDFKLINDFAGHAYGDLVLAAYSDRLVQAVRPDDFVARIGGDEFMVLCTGVREVQAVMQLADRLAEAMRRPFALATGPRAVTASIGVALAVGGDAGELIAAADAAMYQAKRLGGGGVALFDEGLRSAEAARREIAEDLRGVADRGELRLYYQPLMDLRTGTVRGVEALVRWQHPARGLLFPDAFITIAEETGAIIELGEWVLYEACRVLADWERNASSGHRLGISVNVAAQQINDGHLVDVVRRALEAPGADPTLLTVEVTESAVMADVGAATETLRQLRDLGVHLAIDDFGTGHSSLTYLKQFPIHELKLDKSFVDGVGTNAGDSAIVAAVVNLAGAVGLKVVAEGVETLRQSAVLRTLGCDYGQGYLWHRPVPRDVIEPWIEAQLLTANDVGQRDPAHANSAIPLSRRPA